MCPFVPGALERRRLWLAPEQTASHSVSEVAAIISDDKRVLLQAQPTEGDDVLFRVDPLARRREVEALDHAAYCASMS